MTKHTPGPWMYHMGRGAYPRYHIQTTSGYQIASTTQVLDLPSAANENASKKANARLIAAAPDLLDALITAADYLAEFFEEGRENCHVVACDAAIAKAKGETP